MTNESRVWRRGLGPSSKRNGFVCGHIKMCDVVASGDTTGLSPLSPVTTVTTGTVTTVAAVTAPWYHGTTVTTVTTDQPRFLVPHAGCRKFHSLTEIHSSRKLLEPSTHSLSGQSSLLGTQTSTHCHQHQRSLDWLSLDYQSWPHAHFFKKTIFRSLVVATIFSDSDFSMKNHVEFLHNQALNYRQDLFLCFLFFDGNRTRCLYLSIQCSTNWAIGIVWVKMGHCGSRSTWFCQVQCIALFCEFSSLQFPMLYHSLGNFRLFQSSKERNRHHSEAVRGFRDERRTLDNDVIFIKKEEQKLRKVNLLLIPASFTTLASIKSSVCSQMDKLSLSDDSHIWATLAARMVDCTVIWKGCGQTNSQMKWEVLSEERRSLFSLAKQLWRSKIGLQLLYLAGNLRRNETFAENWIFHAVHMENTGVVLMWWCVEVFPSQIWLKCWKVHFRQ
jgi:hypothetical protein